MARPTKYNKEIVAKAQRWFCRLVTLLWFIGLATACTDRKSPDSQRENDAAERAQLADRPVTSSEPNYSAGCEPPRLGPGVYNRILTHDSWDRNYVIAVPEAADGMSVAYPLLIVLHGFGGNGALMRYMLQQGMTFEVEYIVLYPDGAALTNSMRGWNSGHPECCGTALQENLDDVGFIRALVDSVAQEICIDLNRVYATGFSNGGDMAQRLACDASDLVAAVTSVAGRFDYHVTACPGERPVSTILYRGRRDRIVPYANDLLSLVAINTIPALDGFNKIAHNHGCGDHKIKGLSLDNAECLQATDCSGGIELGLCTVSNAAHCWPGIGNCSGPSPESEEEFSANDHMHEFYSRHRLSPF